MSLRRWLPVFGLLLLIGCTYHVREQTDQIVCDMGQQTYDESQPAVEKSAGQGAASGSGAAAASDKQTEKPTKPSSATDVHTTAVLLGPDLDASPILPVNGVEQELQKPPEGKKVEIDIPAVVPGSETKKLPSPLPKEAAERNRVLDQLYPKLPPLPEEPVPQPGPDGQPYTLAQLQEIAEHNSPLLRQAASDVKAAEGNLITAMVYPNPTVSAQKLPSNDGSTAGVAGVGIDQLIKTGGKLRLQAAAAQMALDNAKLALRRARSDLSTSVRTAYFNLLVAEETMRVNRGMAVFTDQMMLLQIAQLKAGIASSYEPAALRAQVYTIRLAYKQAIDGYVYAWKELVTAIGERQLPLTAVAGRADRAIPYFDYDQVLAYVLRNHTDVLTAQNGLEMARFNLKLAQVTPWCPDVDVAVVVQKEFIVAPQQWVYSLSLGVPIPIWDQNKGPIMAAEGALVRATEEPHRVEMALTNSLETAYQNYKANLEAVEYYRLYILPDLVRSYRGVYERRQVDPAWSVTNFGDLLTAQMTYTSGVTTYLGVLGQLWSSAVSVADLLETDDIFKFGQPKTLPPLPDLEHLRPWPCPHPCDTPAAGPCPCGEGAGHSTSADLYPHFSFENEKPSCQASAPTCAVNCQAAPVPVPAAPPVPPALPAPSALPAPLVLPAPPVPTK